MIMKVFSVRDVKAHTFSPPFYVRSDGEARRAFAGIANDARTGVGQYPEDYELVRLGEWDDETGAHGSYEVVPLGFASEYKIKAPAAPIQLVKEV